MRHIDFDDYSRRLAERKANLGIEAPPNDGSLRTNSKRALLKELHDAQRAIGLEVKFPAKY